MLLAIAIFTATECYSQASNGNSINAGYYNFKYSEGDYKIANGTLYYKSNIASVKSALFGGITDDSERGNLKVKSNGNLSTVVLIDGFKRVDDSFSFIYSTCVTFENGEVFEKKENIANINKNEPFQFVFMYNTPTLKKGNLSRVFYMNFIVKDRFSDAVVQGFYKFSLLPQP